MAFLFAGSIPLFAGSVSGRLLDSNGKPVTGARVVAVGYRNLDESLLDATADVEPPKITDTVTSNDGRFRLALEKGALVALRVQAAGHPSVRIAGPFDAAEDAALPDVALADSARVWGRVVDAEGKPVAGALVRADAFNGNPFDEAMDVSEARTAADGSFSIADGVPPPRNVSARAAGYAMLWKNSQVAVEERLVLTRGGVIGGVLVDPSGNPASGAIVRSWNSAIRTGDNGKFRLTGIPSGLQSVEAFWKEDFAARKEGIRVSAGKELEISLRLARAAVITGTVTEDGSRRPIAGAAVFAGETDAGMSRHSRRTSRTDAWGRYRLTGLAARAYDVRAQRPGFLYSDINGVVTEIGVPGTANLALARAASIAGRVVDGKGSPIAGARLRLDGGSSMRRVARRVTSVTAVDGTFRIRELPSGKNVVIEAQKVGFAPARRAGISLKTGEALTGVSLVLRNGLEAKGRIVDAQNNPISGAEVRVTKRENIGPGFSVFGGRPERPDAVSSVDGAFVVRGLEEAEYSATVTRDGFASSIVHGLSVKGGGENDWAVIRLTPGVALTGIVRSSAGQPVIGAHIQWFPLGLGGGVVRERAATTDAEGRFRLDGLAPAIQVQLTAAADGYASTSKSASPPVEDLAIVLRMAGTVRGRVEDADTKRAVAEFSVTSGVTQVGGGASYFMQDWRSGGQASHSDDGSFEIPNVTPGKVTVHAAAAGFRPAEVAVEVAEGETKEGVVLSMRRGGSVAGRVLDGGKATPIANASVSWKSAGVSTMWGDVSGSNSTNTDADGKFRFDSLPAGTVTVTARHTDYAEAAKEVDPDKEASVDLSLGSGSLVSGVVVGRDGRSPVPGATVLLNGLGGPGSDTSRTDESGAFSFEHLRPGRFRLTVRAAEGQALPKEVVVAENQRQEGILLAIRPAGARIRGTVTGLPAGKLGLMRVFGNAKDWGDSTQTDDTGAFAFPDVPAGMIRIQVSVSNGPSRSASRTVEIPEGATEVPVEIAFDGNSRLAGRVTRAERAVAAAWVSAMPEPPSPNASRSSGQTDENGRFALEGLTDGPHVVSIGGQGFAYQKTIAVSGDTPADIAIPSATISGTVTEEGSGDPIQGAHVQAETGREASSSGMKGGVTDASGRYEIAGVDAGTYQVTARKPGYQMRTRSATVASDATDASFALAKGAGVTIRVSDGTTGLPLRNVFATAFGASGLVAFQGSIALDGSGRGEIPSLAPGRYSLYIFAGGFAPRSVPSLQAPAPEVAVAMTPGGRVEVRCDAPTSGTLVDAGGSLYLLGSGRMDGRLFAAPPIVVWENVAPGSYTFLASGPTGAKSYALTVSEGQTSRLDLK